MFALGRLSSSRLWPLANVAVLLPVLATWIVHVQLLPSVVAPVTSFVFVAVRSGAVTTTLSLKLLFASFDSVMLPFGSTVALPLLLGLAKVPIAEGVAVKVMSKLPPAASVIVPLLAVTLRSLLPIEPARLPVPPTPLWFVKLTDP